MRKDVIFKTWERTVQVCEDDIRTIKALSWETDLMRARICVHRHHQDAVHEMLIAINRETYTIPHKQVNKEKSYYMIEGSLRLTFFDNMGNISEWMDLSARNDSGYFMSRFDAGRWHTTFSRTEECVYLEVIQGPFEEQLTQWAAWAPSVKDFKKIEQFKTHILNMRRNGGNGI